MNAMYCSQCGQALPPGSRFCNRCGAAAPAVGTQSPEPPPADVAARPGYGLADDQEVFTLRPTMVFVYVWYAAAALVLIATAALMGIFHNAIPQGAAFIVIAAVGLAAFSVPIYKHVMRRRSVYTLTNHNLEMRYGLIAKTTRNIPLTSIQDVTVTAAVWQRLLNLGDIEIDSASAQGKIILDDIHHPDRYAKLILAEIRKRNSMSRSGV